MSDKTGGETAPGAGVRSEAAGEARGLRLRDPRANFRALRALLQARITRFSAGSGRVAWRIYALSVLALAAIALIFSDAAVGAYRGQWPEGLRRLARAVTDIGESSWYLIPTGIFIVVALMLDWRALERRRRWLMANGFALAGYIFLTVGGSGLIVTLLKRIIGRARPKHFEEHGVLAFDHFASDASFAGFPSGHATTVGAVAAIVALLFPRLRPAVLILAAALACTRIIVGAHYPSDVIAGLGFGMWFAYAMATGFAARGLIFEARQGGLPKVRPPFRRFVAGLPGRFFSSVPFLQRKSAKLR
jgi:undecaprenyl-diphosphatase